MYSMASMTTFGASIAVLGFLLWPECQALLISPPSSHHAKVYSRSASIPGRSLQSLQSCRSGRSRTEMHQARGADTLMDLMSSAVAKSLGRDEVQLQPASGGGASGGGGAQTGAAVDAVSGDKYFIKSAGASTGGGKMLRAEYLGVKEMADTNTIKVPTPVAYGEGGPMNSAFVVFEYFNMGGHGSGRDLGRQLAQMHRHTSSQGFGFHVDNTIGATPQPNLPWVASDWRQFWDTHRLGYMLKLTDNAGLSDGKAQELRKKTSELLSHNPLPSLLHGDLWVRYLV